MKVCTETHTRPGFGEIPAGSLWADDSPYIDDEHFDALAEDIPKPAKKATRKFGTKVEVTPDGDSSVD